MHYLCHLSRRGRSLAKCPRHRAGFCRSANRAQRHNQGGLDTSRSRDAVSVFVRQRGSSTRRTLPVVISASASSRSAHTLDRAWPSLVSMLLAAPRCLMRTDVAVCNLPKGHKSGGVAGGHLRLAALLDRVLTLPHRSAAPVSSVRASASDTSGNGPRPICRCLPPPI